MNWLKKWYKILTKKPVTQKEIDEIVAKAMSDHWRKRILGGR